MEMSNDTESLNNLEETMNVDVNDTETDVTSLATSPKTVVDDITSAIFSTVCEQVATSENQVEKNSEIDETTKTDVPSPPPSKEIVTEIISELFYSVCERIENNLNDKYTKQSCIDSPTPMEAEMNVSNPTEATKLMIAKGSLVPYDISSESDTEDSESDSASSTSETDSTVSAEELDSDDSDDDKIAVRNGQSNKTPFRPIKTRGELGLEDLPPIEHLQISAEGCKLAVIGHVHSIVDTLVAVHSCHGTATLGEDSFLFAEDGSLMGQIFDIFGNTQDPYYAIRFNNTQEIEEKCIKIGDKVFYAPENTSLYTTIFADEIKKLHKGSDASWEYNNEPPDHFLDYSDDECERTAKRKNNSKRTANGTPKIMQKKKKWQQTYAPRTPNAYPILRHPVFRPQFQHGISFPSSSNAAFPQFPSPVPFPAQPNSHGSPQFRLPPPNFGFLPSFASPSQPRPS